MSFTKIKNAKRFTLVPVLCFALTLFLVKAFGLTGMNMENPAYAAAMSLANIEPEAGVESSFIDQFTNWRETSRLESDIRQDENKIYEMTQAELRQVFGPPSLQRKDGEARMIQYQAGNCVADFYYYSDNPKISYFEARRLNQSGASGNNCIEKLVRKH